MITLQLGTKAPEVWLLKVWLNGVVHRYSSPDLPLDLPFGPNTKAAVQKFQGMRGLPADGVVGPMTWRELAQAAKLVPVPAIDPAGRPTQMYWPLFLRDSKRGPVDRMRFRSAFTKTFGNAASQKATGLETMTNFINGDASLTDLRIVAYLLATTKRESAHSFEPVLEGAHGPASGLHQDPASGNCPQSSVHFYCKKIDCPNTNSANYPKLAGITKCPNNKTQHIYHGRGYIQLTLYDNYAGMEDRLGIRLVHYPENALVAENAYKIISSWCQNGPPKSSNRLSNYFGAHLCDYYNARDVVNTDKAKVAWPGAAFDVGTEIADYAKKFEVCLAYGMGRFLD